MIVVLAGGVGAARFLRGLLEVVPGEEVMAIVNVGDDCELHGLHISPDIDTIVYTLSGAIDPERGWGLEGETWQAMDGLARYTDMGAVTWFNLGDRDLATHLWRTGRRRQGATPSEVARDLARAWGLGVDIRPVTDDDVRTIVSTADGDLAFQEYFVRMRHGVPVTGVRFEGIEAARPAPGVLDAIRDADAVVIAPSNPIVSIGPLLAVPGVREALVARQAGSARTAAVSGLVGGEALKGPADRMLRELGHRADAVGVAEQYRDVIDTMLIDDVDAALAPEVEALGLQVIVTDTIMSRPGVGAALARAAIGTART